MNKKLLLYGAIVVMLVSIALAATGEINTLIAWWLTLTLLLPPLLWALKMRYVAPITISALACASQLITLPFFYINRADFAWAHVKPYQFTGVEALPMLLKVSFFLILLNLLFAALYKITFIGGSHRKIANLSHEIGSPLPTRLGPYLKPSSHSAGGIYTFGFLFFMAALTPLNLWMFSQGISIVGVAPPALPYRLSGILHYFTKYIAVLILAYFYFKTRRGWLPMSLMLGYSWILGLSSVSRSSLMFVVLPVMLFAWLDNRRLMLTVAAFVATIGFAVVTGARNFVYFVSDGITGGNFDTGIAQILSDIVSSQESELFSLKAIMFAISNIFSRIEGFENLVMSEYYDSYQVSGPLAILIGMIWQGFSSINLDAHHIQWQGNTLPEGFVNGGGLLSTTVILSNAGWWWIALAAIVAAATLVILEKSVRRLDGQYRLKNLLTTPTIGFLSITYFAGSAGSIQFVYPFIVLFILSFLPPLLRTKNRQLKKPTLMKRVDPVEPVNA